MERPEAPPRTWFPDELAFAGRENLDPGHAARYDEKEDASPGEEVRLLRKLGVDSDATVVDIGSGTGQFALAAAEEFGRVVAVDVSEVMLERLREKLAGRSPGNLELVHAGFLTYEHAGSAAEVIYSRLALHHLPDFWKAIALRRMAGMLSPGGILRLIDVAYSFDPEEAAPRIDSWIARYTGGSGDSDWTGEDVEEHVRNEHSTFTWLLEPMIERAGFRIERADYDGDGVIAGYVCVRTPD
jgi:ubiquinone/menaquinone biosynthesis C-methylase UbiE